MPLSDEELGILIRFMAGNADAITAPAEKVDEVVRKTRHTLDHMADVSAKRSAAVKSRFVKQTGANENPRPVERNDSNESNSIESIQSIPFIASNTRELDNSNRNQPRGREEILVLTPGLLDWFKATCPLVDPETLRDLWHAENQATGWQTARGAPIQDRMASLKRYALMAQGMIRDGKPHTAAKRRIAAVGRFAEYDEPAAN